MASCPDEPLLQSCKASPEVGLRNGSTGRNAAGDWPYVRAQLGAFYKELLKLEPGLAMTHWTVTFQDDSEMTRVRADKNRRNAHIAFVRAHPELQIGGALAMRPMQDFPGAIWNVEADSRADVERLIISDPFYVALLRRYKITAWTEVAAHTA